MSRLTQVDLDDLADEYSGILKDTLTSDTRAEQEKAWLDWLRLYDGIPTDPVKTYPWEGASNLVVQLVGTYVDQLVARIVGSVFTVRPHWVCTTPNKEWMRHADPMERYQDWCRQFLWNQKLVISTGALELVKLGTAIWSNFWRNETFYTKTEVDGKLKPTGQYIGPYPEWIPRKDFLLPDGFTDLQKAPVVFVNQWFTWEDLQRLEYRDFIENLDDIAEQPDPPGSLEALYKQDGRDEQDRSDRIKMWCIRQVWFTKDIDGDGYPEAYAAMLHERSGTWLRFKPNPYDQGERPFFKATLVEQEGKFDGKGLPQQLLDYQEEASTIHNQRRDNNHLANTVMFKARRGSGVQAKEKVYPGRIFLVTDVNDLAPFTAGTAANSTVQEEQLTILLAEKRIGLSDLTLGRENSPLGRAAAATVMALMQENARRFEFEIQLLNEALSMQGRQNLMLWQTHGLPQPEQKASPEKVLDAQSAALVRELMHEKEAIYVSLNVATAAVNREVSKQASNEMALRVEHYADKMLEYGQMLINPQVPAPAKQIFLRVLEGLDTAMKRVFSSHETYDLEDALVAEQLAALLSPQAQAQIPGGNGVSIPGSLGGVPAAAHGAAL